MLKRFRANLGWGGRVVRGCLGLGLGMGAVYAMSWSVGLGIGLGVLAVFVLFEAIQGWCALRACGLKTPW